MDYNGNDRVNGLEQRQYDHLQRVEEPEIQIHVSTCNVRYLIVLKILRALKALTALNILRT